MTSAQHGTRLARVAGVPLELVSAYFRFVAELSERVIAEGGPLDGTEIDLAGSTDEVAVEMSDRSLHRYVRTSVVRLLRSGARGAVFRWAGRQ